MPNETLLDAITTYLMERLGKSCPQWRAQEMAETCINKANGREEDAWLRAEWVWAVL